MATLNLSNLINGAANEVIASAKITPESGTPHPVSMVQDDGSLSIVSCSFCGNNLTMQEFQNISDNSTDAEMKDMANMMCDACAEGPSDETANRATNSGISGNIPEIRSTIAGNTGVTVIDLDMSKAYMQNIPGSVQIGSMFYLPKVVNSLAPAAAPAAAPAPAPAAATLALPKPATVPVIAGGNAKTDAILLETIAKFQSAKRADGKPSGTFAVKVHGWLHAAGIPESKVREAVAGAIKRNVISKMGITTKRGTMILYFDFKVRPIHTEVVEDAIKTATKAAFGV